MMAGPMATQLDIRYNQKTKTYHTVHLNADPRKALYLDGIFRETSTADIQSALVGKGLTTLPNAAIMQTS